MVPTRHHRQTRRSVLARPLISWELEVGSWELEVIQSLKISLKHRNADQNSKLTMSWEVGVGSWEVGVGSDAGSRVLAKAS